MLFSGLLTIQKRGVIVVPRQCSGSLAIEFPELDCRLIANARVEKMATLVQLPATLKSSLELPRKFPAIIKSSAVDPGEPFLEALNNRVVFSSTIKHHKGGSHVNIPKAWSRGMLNLGWSSAHMRLDGEIEKTLIQLRPNTQGVVVLTLPKGRSGPVKIELTRAVVEAIELVCDGFDWGAVPFDRPRAFLSDRMILPSPRSQFSMKRVTPRASTLWLLGLYLAEGSKKGLQFSLPQKSRLVMARAITCIKSLGIAHSDLLFQVQFGRTSKAHAESYYRSIGLPFDIRKYIDWEKHTHGSIISIRKSYAFSKLINSVFNTINIDKWSIEDRKQFLFGFLTGDGNVSNDASGPEIRAACGNEVEARLIAKLLDEYLERSPKEVPYVRDSHKMDGERGGYDVRRSLSAPLTVKLIEDEVFIHSLSRVRLFFIAHRVLYRVTPGHTALGYLENGNPTNKLLDLRARLDKYEDEWNYIKRKYPTEDSASPGIKGILYEYGKHPNHSTQQKQLNNDPSVHHPVEKRAQIDEILAGSNDLRIYEAHAGEGGCTIAYEKFGLVLANTIEDGDAIDVLRKNLLDKLRFDVVDLDPYGFPFKLLMNGALELVRIPGYLFVTCANPKKVHGAGSYRIRDAFFDREFFEAEDVCVWIDRIAKSLGRSAVLISRLDLPTVWRLAFKINDFA